MQEFTPEQLEYIKELKRRAEAGELPPLKVRKKKKKWKRISDVKRFIYCINELNESSSQLAKRFQVSTATVHRLRRKLREQGHELKTQQAGQPKRKLPTKDSI